VTVLYLILKYSECLIGVVIFQDNAGLLWCYFQVCSWKKTI